MTIFCNDAVTSSFTLAYCTATGSELSSLSLAVQRFTKHSPTSRILARTAAQLFDQYEIRTFVDKALASDAIVLCLHGGAASCPAFEPLMQALKTCADAKRPVLIIHATGGDEEALALARQHSDGFDATGDGSLWQRLTAYLRQGGADNLYHFLCSMQAIVAHTDNIEQQRAAASIPDPAPLPQQGLWHPDLPHGFIDAEGIAAWREAHLDPTKPTLGLWFYQTDMINDNLQFISALIREIERQGGNVLAIFHNRHPDPALGNMGADAVAKAFFYHEGKPCIDTLLSPLGFSLTLSHEAHRTILPELDVPCLQLFKTSQPLEEWEHNVAGLTTMEVSYLVAQPEFDGNLITLPVATQEEEGLDPLTGALIRKHHPMPERLAHSVSLAMNWARLRHIPNEERRIAIVFHHYPPRNDRIGCAVGLDSFASVLRLLEAMQARGYTTGEAFTSPDELAHTFLDTVSWDGRWLPPEALAERAEHTVSGEATRDRAAALPDAARHKQEADWGKAPGSLFVHKDTMLLPGIQRGNVFITIQPPRGKLENIAQSCHDPWLTPPHVYTGLYDFIRHDFQAHAVLHVGKHGSLEWLPGKAVGLSESCWPDIMISDLPNIYPYIINDPSEGTQAKRRSYCAIVDHLTPSFTNADLYEDLGAVDELLRARAAAASMDPAKLDILDTQLWQAVCKADLHASLGLEATTPPVPFDDFLETLHSFLSDLADTMISDGLHTLGQVPQGEQLIELMAQLVRLENGSVPSLREALVDSMGLHYDDLLAQRGTVIAGRTETGGQIIAHAHRLALELIRQLANEGFAPEAVPAVQQRVLEQCPYSSSQAPFEQTAASALTEASSNADCRVPNSADAPVSTPHEQVDGALQTTQHGLPPYKAHAGVTQTLTYLAEHLYPTLLQTEEELTACLHAFEGGFVLPGASGAPTRGQAHILPTGRNFYSVDPRKIPSPAAWETGKRLAHALLDGYRAAHEDAWPENVGILVYGGTTMRSQGDDVAEILYLLGVRPVWEERNGEVKGLEIIPLEDLGRPRIDVTPRISGFFRDCFPNLVELIDDAVQLVANLDDGERNLVRRHVLADVQDYQKQGLAEAEAWRLASLRVFGCPPGTYGAGVAELVESKQWKERRDLAAAYIFYSSHAYGRGSYGDKAEQAFTKQLARMDVTVKNEDSREYDMFSCTDYYNYYGGYIAAAESIRGTQPWSVVGDASDPKRIRMRTTQEEAQHVLRARLVNPKWIAGLMRHGYKGAGEVSKMMDVILGWDATAGVVEDWMYDRVARQYILNEEVREWMERVNPYARHNILNKLLEAIARGMWHATPEREAELRQAYLAIEGDIEEATDA